MKIFNIVTLLSPLLLASCATVSTPAANSMVEADAKMVENCKFKGTFAGRSMLGGIVSGTSERNSLESAKAQAGANGATHYVIDDVVSANFQRGSRISIKGYTCTV